MSAHTPAITRERALILQTLRAAVTALGSVVGRNTEIVLHDLDHPEKSVLAIANGHVTGRKPGSPVLAVPVEDQGLKTLLNDDARTGDNTPTVIPDYPTRGKNGQTLRSATALYRDSNGQPFAALCINTDNSELLAAQRCLNSLLNGADSTQQPAEESADMEQLMTDIIADSLNEMNGDARLSRKQAKLAAVRKMQDRGMFIVKGGIEKAAAALGVTRYTIYNYLDELRDERSGNAS
ncbi:helix-turn-helix transcriptional regulator [Erwinia sorbitola]|uniref:Transcriptional regulator n=1 Tax=Erwinia sorbitola TaxID=2681984 RepID=A0A6I6F4D9_9GAMM|nr:PAS domain-containing protein [Erwinia sorbitola]QGU88750.1 hypothetical protein GN242_16630 [Erwinia sorbitola]